MAAVCKMYKQLFFAHFSIRCLSSQLRKAPISHTGFPNLKVINIRKNTVDNYYLMSSNFTVINS